MMIIFWITLLTTGLMSLINWLHPATFSSHLIFLTLSISALALIFSHHD